MTVPVFLDSGIFLALLNRRDRWHPLARALFDGPKPRWSTSLLVISEAYSWFLHRMGEESARNLRLLVDSLAGLKVFEATVEHHKEAVKVLDRFRGSKLTYVDASSLALIEGHKIGCVWATDYHLALTGRGSCLASNTRILIYQAVCALDRPCVVRGLTRVITPSLLQMPRRELSRRHNRIAVGQRE